MRYIVLSGIFLSLETNAPHKFSGMQMIYSSANRVLFSFNEIISFNLQKANCATCVCFNFNFSQISVSVSIICVVLPATEEAPHWERHCDHCVPGTGSSPFHAQSHSVSLSACLHHCSGAQPLLWRHMLQVGPSGRLLGDKLRVDLHLSNFLICLRQYLK